MHKSTFIVILVLLCHITTPFTLVSPVNASPLPELTNEEKEYLAQKSVIRVGVDPAWMPFEAIEKNTHVGMSADYLNLVADKLGIRFQLVPTVNWIETLEKGKTRGCDIFALAMETPERKTYMNFTQPYIVIPLVIATTKDAPFIADLPDVIDRRIGMVKGYAFVEFLKAEYPEMRVIEFDTLYDGLVALEKNEIYGFIDNLTSISYEITRSFSSSLKISGRVNRNWNLGIAVRNDAPVLLSILDKAVKSIDNNAVQEIHSKWISVTYEHRFDYSLAWKILAVIGIIAFFFMYSYLKIKKYNRTLQELNGRLQDSEASFRSLLNKAHEGIAVVQNKRLMYVNPSVCKITGYDEAQLLALDSFLPLVAPEDRDTMITNHLNRLAGKPSPDRYESNVLRPDGSRCPIEMSGVLIRWNGEVATLNVVSDISERKAAEEVVRFMALHDNLTQLPNRYLFKERLERALSQARRSNQPLALLFIDLNGFKTVNDTHGHDVGDLLIKGVAERLQSLMRESDTLARMGGDEFVILLPLVNGQSGVEALIARIEGVLEPPFHFGSLEIESHASVGFALYPEHGKTEEELLRTADLRMYKDKQEKKRGRA